jgi:DNA-directed RNA polymerase subunit RPC12/RpoP
METKMLICNECGAVFEEPRIYYEHHPYGMGTAAEEWAVCPVCGESGFEEAYQCSRCGEYFGFDDLDYIGHSLYCEMCSDELFD